MDTRKPYAHRSKQEWQLLLKAHRESGLNIRQFCRHNNFAVSNFYAWHKKLSQAVDLEPQTSTSFVQIDLPQESRNNSQGSNNQESAWMTEIQIGPYVTLKVSH